MNSPCFFQANRGTKTKGYRNVQFSKLKKLAILIPNPFLYPFGCCRRDTQTSTKTNGYPNAEFSENQKRHFDTPSVLIPFQVGFAEILRIQRNTLSCESAFLSLPKRLLTGKKKAYTTSTERNLLENVSGLKGKLSRPVVDARKPYKNQRSPKLPPKSFLCGPHFFLRRRYATSAWNRFGGTS